MKLKNLFYDGFDSKLIENALLDGLFEIPVLEAPKEIMIPSVAVPFSKRKSIANPAEEMLVFYEHDPVFRDFISVPQKYMNELKNIRMISTPDCSLYRDMPLWAQIMNIAISRSVGYYLQRQGKYVIPNVRQGDARTYTKKTFGFALAFSGVPHNGVVSIGANGRARRKEDKYFLEAGLDAMLEELTPRVVVAYGSCCPAIFGKYERYANFCYLPDWKACVHSGKKED